MVRTWTFQNWTEVQFKVQRSGWTELKVQFKVQAGGRGDEPVRTCSNLDWSVSTYDEEILWKIVICERITMHGSGQRDFVKDGDLWVNCNAWLRVMAGIRIWQVEASSISLPEPQAQLEVTLSIMIVTLLYPSHSRWSSYATANLAAINCTCFLSTFMGGHSGMCFTFLVDFLHLTLHRITTVRKLKVTLNKMADVNLNTTNLLPIS